MVCRKREISFVIEKKPLKRLIRLEPDHGFPIRLVVPSQIGGRSVKWLKKIELSDRESQHYLHFHDNKVLPMPVDPDRARAEKGWWYDPRYNNGCVLYRSG
jgi:nitrate reductase (NAD(P)H)